MNTTDLIKLLGKKVFIYFKGGEKGIYGKLKYIDNHFCIGNTSFKPYQVRKIESEGEK